jgi:hypothetical protein
MSLSEARGGPLFPQRAVGTVQSPLGLKHSPRHDPRKPWPSLGPNKTLFTEMGQPQARVCQLLI